MIWRIALRKCGKLICAKMARVDGVVIKPDTYYTLINGEFVEESV